MQLIRKLYINVNYFDEQLKGWTDGGARPPLTRAGTKTTNNIFCSPIRFPLVGPKGVLSRLAVGSLGTAPRVPPTSRSGSPAIVDRFPLEVEK